MSAALETPQDRKNIRQKASAVGKSHQEQKYHYFCVPFDAPAAAHFRAKAKGYEMVPEMTTEMETIYRIPLEQYQAAAKVNEDRAKRHMPKFETAQAQPTGGVPGSITSGFVDTGESISLNEAFQKSSDD